MRRRVGGGPTGWRWGETLTHGGEFQGTACSRKGLAWKERKKQTKTMGHEGVARDELRTRDRDYIGHCRPL